MGVASTRKKISWWWAVGLGVFFLFIFAGNIVKLLTVNPWIKASNAVSFSAHNPLPGRHDIRNSVKAVIDAYDGTVDLYMADPTDPLIQTFAQSSPLNFHPNDWLIMS